MKKVLIGILILIPIIILLVVALVSNLIQLQAWIAVDGISVTLKDSDEEVNSLSLYLDVRDNTVFNLQDWVDVLVTPEKANNYTVEWSISNVVCTDDEYDRQYKDYLENPVGTPVHPAAVLVDGEGRDAEINNTGDFKINAYCNFNVSVRAETHFWTFFVDIVGNTVHTVSLTGVDGATTGELTVGQSARLCASYVPVDSIITQLDYASDAPSVAEVDQNGVITARSAGTANISVTADKYDGTGTVTSNVYRVEVLEGAGIYGDSVTLARTADGAYTFAQLGIDGGAVDASASTGCTVTASGIVINGESASVALKNGKTLDVSLCGANDIRILHSEVYAQESGYVLGVGERALQLRASYAATSDGRVPTGVAWSSDNTDVATVDSDGKVTGISNGLATITATLGASSFSVTLNVQRKATSLRLKTSNESLEVGLARQTVFASDRYVYETDAEGGEHSRDKVANGVLIHIQGEPTGSEEEIAAFYERYNFLIEEGKDYAHMDSEVANRVVFDGAALEGKGVSPVKVTVTAKYPRFEANLRHVTDSVTLSVVYGVEINSFEQVFRATQDQREYANREDNVIPERDVETLTAPNGKQYKVTEAQYSKRTYAMVLAASIALPDDITLSHVDANGKDVKLFGDFYGNGFTVSSKPAQVVDTNSVLVAAMQSGITVSNAILRHEDRSVDILDGKTFSNSYCLRAVAEAGSSRRVTDIRAEYCIFENTYGGVNADNGDIDIVGCVFRNVSSVGIYSYARVQEEDPEGTGNVEYFLKYNHIGVHNCVLSSIVAVSMSVSFENFVLESGGRGRFSDAPDKAASIAESCAWVEETLVPKGYTQMVTQTGFLDIYNWQNAAKATFIDTGNNTYNSILSAVAGPMLSQHPAFSSHIVTYNDVDYFPIGFITSGVYMDEARFDEPTFAVIEMEDKRFSSVDLHGLSADVEGLASDVKVIIETIISKMTFKMYCYNSDSSITPTSTYELNSAFIDHLHS